MEDRVNYSCVTYVSMDCWHQKVLKRNKNIVFENEDKPEAPSTISIYEKKTMHSSIYLSKLSTKEIISESAVPSKLLFTIQKWGSGRKTPPQWKTKNTKKVTWMWDSQKQIMMVCLSVWFEEMYCLLSMCLAVPCFLLNCSIVLRKTTSIWKINHLIFSKGSVMNFFCFTDITDNII